MGITLEDSKWSILSGPSFKLPWHFLAHSALDFATGPFPPREVCSGLFPKILCPFFAKIIILMIFRGGKNSIGARGLEPVAKLGENGWPPLLDKIKIKFD